MLLAAAALCAVAEASAAGLPGGDDRLLDSFVEDGALIDKMWIEIGAEGRGSDEGDDLAMRLRAAFRYGRDVEAGVDLGLLRRGREAGATLFGTDVPTEFAHTGASDPQIFGKYRLLRGACDLAIGARFSLPAASDDSGLTSGAYEGRGFVAFRGAWRKAALIGHLGLGKSGDARYETGAEGETFATGSFGSVVFLSRLWNLTAEIDFEGARFEGEEERGRGVVGLDWHPTQNLRVRGGIGDGWGRDAGAIRGLAWVAFHF
ncbi:MAG TPA: hypothetical protein VFC25_08515 [Verrucomicrobiae bacterium]|nr:hypothetical protein [Verrucomicrobiae bacterium]